MQTGVRRDLVGYGDGYPAIQWQNGARIAVLVEGQHHLIQAALFNQFQGGGTRNPSW